MLFSNRANLYFSMDRHEDALDDYISAELEKSLDNHCKNIIKIACRAPELLIYALTRYSERKGDNWGNSELGRQLLEQGSQRAADYPEVAATMQQIEREDSPPQDPDSVE